MSLRAWVDHRGPTSAPRTGEMDRVSSDKDKSEAQLARFGAGVPATVVEQERARLADWSSKLDALSAQRARLA